VRLDGLRVLVVENEPSAREAFMEMIQSFGAEVKTAASAKEALEVFQDYGPDVLVSDIAMPDEDGYNLIRKIRALKATRGGDVPAVAVTAHAGKEDIERALSAGFQSHVSKPVNSVHLANVIATVAAKKTE
jgi:two-component system OmpR family response regulator